MRRGMAPALCGVGGFLMVVVSTFGITAMPAAAQPTCVLNPVLEVVDSDGDGIATVAELQAFAAATESAELAAQAEALTEAGVSGIQYRDCTPSGDGRGGGPGNDGNADEDGFVSPDPENCTVEPRSLESLLAISGTNEAGTPVAPPPSEAPATPGIQVPEGEPADPVTVAAVTATIHELVACENAGDVRRAFALYTDSVLIGLAAQNPRTEEERIAQYGGTPEARPADAFASVRMVEVRTLSSGEAVAVFDYRDPSGSGTIYTLVYRLIQEGDRYLIDEVVDTVTMPMGTPPA